ncbi:MAG TPA: alpha/beta hydrolase [Polyangia bacterium]|jgi:pimeloyl-ACP methyl ester carboxylesterase|nr:alpha/beta hydrolase [Polyangia bacterium]
MERHIDNLFIDDGGGASSTTTSPAPAPIVFLHSAAGNTTHFSAQLAHMRGGRRAIALDFRGHGRSAPPPDGDYSIAGLAADVARVVDALDLGRFVLAGHSMGGAAAAAYAGAHPERLAGLLLLDPASDGRALPAELRAAIISALRSPAYLRAVEDYWAPMLEPSSPAVRARLAADLRSTPRQAVVGTLASLFEFDPVTPLRRYAGPALALITRFNETPASYQELVPRIPHRRIDGVGHWLHLDAPEVVNREIDRFLTADQSRG